MATLADLKTGDQFLFACQVTSLDANGIGLALFGPASVKAADAAIHLDGTMSGNLAATPDQVPINIVTGFVPISQGDILQNGETGETVVCRWSEIKPDGTVHWSSSGTHRVVYTANGWTVIGHAEI